MTKVLLVVLGLSAVAARAEPLAPPALAIPYGHNEAAGAFAEVNGIRLHYESYGTGEPVLLIHGNGGDIGAMGYQIEFFAPHYRVIATDSRNHGLSDKVAGRLTYEQMAEDLNTLLDQLHLKSIRILGWSDGGIIGLLLAIHHPDKVGRLAIMGANLFPEGAHQWAIDAVAAGAQQADEMIAKGDKSQPWALNKQLLDLMGQQPHIPTADLEKIAIPVLVMAGDRDVVRPEHTQLIVDHLPHAQLAIFPGSTHMAPWRDHRLFNETVARFFAEPFARPETRADFGM